MTRHKARPLRAARAARPQILYSGPGAPCIIEATGERTPITSNRYEAAQRALREIWEQRPRPQSPERENWEAGPLKAARREVRAAWLETAGSYGINPDRIEV